MKTDRPPSQIKALALATLVDVLIVLLAVLVFVAL